MFKKICDKCEKEIKKSDFIEFDQENKHYTYVKKNNFSFSKFDMGSNLTNIHLCKKCDDEFKEWLNLRPRKIKGSDKK